MSVKLPFRSLFARMSISTHLQQRQTLCCFFRVGVDTDQTFVSPCSGSLPFQRAIVDNTLFLEILNSQAALCAGKGNDRVAQDRTGREARAGSAVGAIV